MTYKQFFLISSVSVFRLDFNSVYRLAFLLFFLQHICDILKKNLEVDQCKAEVSS